MSRPADDRQAKAVAVREAMPDDMLAFVDGWREIDPGCRLVSLQTPGLCIGRPDTEPGIAVADMVIDPPNVKRGAR